MYETLTSDSAEYILLPKSPVRSIGGQIRPICPPIVMLRLPIISALSMLAKKVSVHERVSERGTASHRLRVISHHGDNLPYGGLFHILSPYEGTVPVNQHAGEFLRTQPDKGFRNHPTDDSLIILPKHLPEISRLTVTEIAVSVGFNSRQYLTRAFTREAGCSPGVYRKTKGNSSVYQGFPHPLL